jgi:glutathione S-transferase
VVGRHNNKNNNMVLKIYGVPQATCTKRVIATLLEKNIPYEMVPVDVRAGEHKREPYLSINPFGVIPALDDDGFIVIESRAICRYIENKHKNHGIELVPTELKANSRFEQGAYIETNEFDPHASQLVYELLFKGMFGGSADEEKVKQHTEKLEKVLDVYEKILSKQEFIGGDVFTLADIYHYPYGSLLTAIKLGHLVDDRPNVKAWWDRITDRPAWKEANVSF